MGSKDDSNIKDEEMYKALREEGNSKEKAARIANAAHNEGRSKIGAKGGHSEKYEKWTVDELQEKAKEIGIEHRTDMNKRQLIDALRHH
ncbi:MAG TPA: Rho termination factor N-terminal domain-containing protein [Gammaproteobacteria bacterium]